MKTQTQKMRPIPTSVSMEEFLRTKTFLLKETEPWMQELKESVAGECAEILKGMYLTDDERLEVMYGNQRTEEWDEKRKNKVTGSMGGAAVGHSGYDNIRATVKKMLYPEKCTSAAMKRGTKLEPHIFAMAAVFFEKHYQTGNDDIWLEEVGLCIDKEYPWLGASTDGILHVNGKRTILEIKAPSSRKIDVIPEDYYDQMHIQMFCLKIKDGWFIVYTPEKLVCMYFQFNQKYWDQHLFPALQFFFMELFLWRLCLKNKGLLKHKDVDPKRPAKRAAPKKATETKESDDEEDSEDDFEQFFEKPETKRKRK
jgi:putative phage-type endonuclease